MVCREVSYAPILHRVSLSVGPGEFVALIGPNGAGKSTLLQLLVHLRRPTSGEVLAGDRPVGSMRARERSRKLGYLPQQTVVDIGCSVRDIVGMGRYAHSGGGDRRAVDGILERLELGPLAERDIRTLSGGERQRAFLGRVLAQDAETLLLDEPVTGLDAGFQLDLLEVCAGLAREGKGVLVTLHDLEHVLRYADRAVLLQGGRVTGQGAPSDVLTGDAAMRAFGVQAAIFRDPVSGLPRLSLKRLRDGADREPADSGTVSAAVSKGAR